MTIKPDTLRRISSGYGRLLRFVIPAALALSCAGSGNGTYTLENQTVEVVLEKTVPAVRQYVLNPGGRRLHGNVRNTGPEVSVYQGGVAVGSDLTEVSYRSEQADNTVTYHGQVVCAGKEAVTFDLVFALGGDGLAIELENVAEREGFYLIDVLLPGLVSVGAGDDAGKLAISADAGRLIDVAAATPKSYEYEIDWLNPVLAGVAYTPEVIGVVDTESIENHGVANVFEYDGAKFGSLSVRLMYRLAEYDLEEFGTVVAVTDPEHLLKVQDSSRVTVMIAGDYDNDGEVSWVDGTKMLREKVAAVPNPYYRDKVFVRTFVDRPPTSRDTTGRREELKFDEVLQRIREFAAQTDSAACVMYLLGWQYEGHDSGYPSVDKVNENLGGYKALANLIREAKRYNVNVTFYDNYDDSYPDHPGWDPDVICRDPRGNLIKGGVWEGHQSYLISSHKYAVKSGLDRVRFTLDTYPVEKAYFIDVLSGGFNGGRKYDFNPESPAGAIKNFEGKLSILAEFNKRGIDVATEDFTGYFVGHVGTFGNIIAFDNEYFTHEEAIPFIPFIYHGKTSYGMKISDRSQNLTRWVYGHRAEKFTNRRTVFTPDDFILDALPKQKLYGKEMKSYHTEGDLQRVTYEDGSVVEVNVNADQYSVWLEDGRLIARNYTSFVPAGNNAFLACSRDGGAFEYPIPAAWQDESRIRVLKMNRDGTREATPFTLNESNLGFHAVPKAPYKIVYR